MSLVKVDTTDGFNIMLSLINHRAATVNIGIATHKP